jgi:phospho-2-dehydro-3-deoxyheptonate aldolase
MKAEIPVSDAARHGGRRARASRILRKEDARLLVVTGPCSIHDE